MGTRTETAPTQADTADAAVRHTDVAIIGAGSAGLNARRAAMAEGAAVLLIDPGPFGTTCARVGCMPSKLLIAAANHAHAARTAAEFGVKVGTVTVDGPAVMARLRRLRDGFVSKTIANSTAKIEASGGLIRARARLLTPTRIQLDDGSVVQAKSVIIATGSRTFVPPPYRDLGDRLLSNESVFELETLPERLLVVGAGAIGLELGQAMTRLGVRTTVLELQDRIAALQDPKVAAVARQTFAASMDVHFHHQLTSVEKLEAGVRVRFVDDSCVARDEIYDYVLSAAGRRPALDGLGLEALGLAPLPDIDDRTGQVGALPLFLAGDVWAKRTLLHEAAHEGVIAGGNAARFPDVLPSDRKTGLAVVFSEPQIAIVGRGFDQLDLASTVIGELDFAMQSRAKVMGEARGLLRIYAGRATGMLLGATLIGPAAEHLGHLLAWVVQRGLTADDVLDLPFYHPTVEEGVQGALRSISAEVKRASREQRTSIAAA